MKPSSLRFGRVAVATALMCAAMAAAPMSASAQVSTYDPHYMVMDPPIIYPGAVVRIMAVPPKGATGGSVRLAGREFGGFLEKGLLWVYIAVDLNTPPGPYRLDYTMGDWQGHRMVTVRDREFAEERLQVSSSFVELGELTLARVEREKARLDEVWYSRSPERRWELAFLQPAKGELGSPFGLRRFFNGEPRSPHSGLDVKADTGEPVFASNSGRVVVAEDQFFTGNLVVIDHGLGLYTYYAHLSQVGVLAGEIVERGELVGLVGATGRVTGAHLHWGAKLGGARVDPETLPGIVLSGRPAVEPDDDPDDKADDKADDSVEGSAEGAMEDSTP